MLFFIVISYIGQYTLSLFMDIKDKIKNAIIAGIVGDALGVPVASTTRQELALCAVKNMLGYGRYDQPEGTWSDDASLTMCTMESLLKGYDIEDMGKTFCSWLFDGHWTSTGFVFDSGLTTFQALDRIHSGGVSARNSGCYHEEDNGNGALMRMLPVALYFRKEPIDDFLAHVHEISSITHSHPRAQMGCGIYALLVRNLLAGEDKFRAYSSAVKQALDSYGAQPFFKPEMTHFIRILGGAIADLAQDDINSSGYLIDTLEASLWCLLKYDSTKDILLAAVNLGLDTDTTGMVAGGMAGLLYGLDGVPAGWVDSLARKTEINELIDRFVHAIA
jgi:ADP-ribosyl-[dinitrogen reductase] hydrolase